MAVKGNVPALPLRRSSRQRTASLGMPSGSEYHESEKSMEVLDAHHEDAADEPVVEYATTLRGRKIAKKTYFESAGSDDNNFPSHTRRAKVQPYDDDDEDEDAPRRATRRTRASTMAGFIASDDDLHPFDHTEKRHSKKPPPRTTSRGRSANHRLASPAATFS